MSAGRLEGVRVLVTRPRERAQELCFLLEDEGAEVIALPLLELLPPDDPRPLQAAAEQIQRYRWVVLASPSGAQAIAEAARVAGTLDRLVTLEVAAIGPATARAAKELGLKVSCEAGTSTGPGLFEALRGGLKPTDELLLATAQEGRLELFDALCEAGFSVCRVAAYRSEKVSIDEATLAELAKAPPQVVVLGSPRTAEALLEATGELGRRLLSTARVVAIGPTTGAAVESLGFAKPIVSERPTSAALVEAAVRAIETWLR